MYLTKFLYNIEYKSELLKLIIESLEYKENVRNNNYKKILRNDYYKENLRNNNYKKILRNNIYKENLRNNIYKENLRNNNYKKNLRNNNYKKNLRNNNYKKILYKRLFFFRLFENVIIFKYHKKNIKFNIFFNKFGKILDINVKRFNIIYKHGWVFGLSYLLNFIYSYLFKFKLLSHDKKFNNLNSFFDFFNYKFGFNKTLAFININDLNIDTLFNYKEYNVDNVNLINGWYDDIRQKIINNFKISDFVDLSLRENLFFQNLHFRFFNIIKYKFWKNKFIFLRLYNLYLFWIFIFYDCFYIYIYLLFFNLWLRFFFILLYFLFNFNKFYFRYIYLYNFCNIYYNLFNFIDFNIIKFCNKNLIKINFNFNFFFYYNFFKSIIIYNNTFDIFNNMMSYKFLDIKFKKHYIVNLYIYSFGNECFRFLL